MEAMIAELEEYQDNVAHEAFLSYSVENGDVPAGQLESTNYEISDLRCLISEAPDYLRKHNGFRIKRDLS